MDKNTIIGLILIALVLIGFSWYNTSQMPEAPTVPAEQAAVVDTVKDAAALQKEVARKIAADSSDIFFAQTQGSNREIVLQNNKVQVKVATQGAAVSEVLLKEYKSYADFKEGKDNSLLLYTRKIGRASCRERV